MQSQGDCHSLFNLVSINRKRFWPLSCFQEICFIIRLVKYIKKTIPGGIFKVPSGLQYEMKVKLLFLSLKLILHVFIAF